MKFGRQGIMILFLLGTVALLMAIFSPNVFKDVSAQDRTATAWSLAAKGVIESELEVELSSQITGVIQDVQVEEGELVKAGQLLISFTDEKVLAKRDLAEAELRQSQAHLNQLERGYRSEDIESAQWIFERNAAIFDEARDEMVRMEQLFKAGAIAETDRDKAARDHDVALADKREANANLKKLNKGPRKEEIASARADRDRALAELNYGRATLQDYKIMSPIDGLIIIRTAESGETVDIGTPLFTIIDPDNLRIWAELEEADTGKVDEGQDVEIKVDAFPGKRFKGKVTKVFNAVQRKRQKSFDPVASFDINTQKIHIELDDYSGLVHGLTVTVLFTQ